ncbi:MAG TPA: methylamine utilization protein [Usitatibacter sp.]|nr:methylamine utilization protein [Usitatibacter sp.]
MMFMLAVAAAPAASAAAVEVVARDSAGQPVADAAIYLVSASGGSEARSQRTVAVEQVDREFVPYVSVIQVGTVVTFPNRDPILHHVYSFSPAKPFEIKLYSGKSPTEVLFDHAGVVTLGCNIHDWMVGYIVVVPTPHFARTDATGVARLRDLPAGPYELRAWHPQQRAAVAAQPLTLAATASASAVVDFVLQPRKAKYKPPLDRLKY